MKHLYRNILIAVLAGIILYAVMTIWADFDDVTTTIASFRWPLLPLILGLTFLNYVMRFLKWHYYIGRLGISLRWTRSLHIFLSGLAFSVTPYKAGEVVKSWLLKQTCGAAVNRTMPVVLAERITDLLGMILLASVGVFSYRYGGIAIGITTFLVVGFIIVIQSRTLSLKLLGKLDRVPLVRRFSHGFLGAYESTHELLKPKPAVVATLVSALSWFCECLATWLVVMAFGADISLWQATFVFAFSSIAGAIVFIPGGLGVADASMAGLLMLFGIESGVAVSATLIIRLSTLWFGVFIGLITITRFIKPEDRQVQIENE